MRRAVILLAMMGARLAAQPASIEGTVVDQTTGKPVERVHISFSGSENYGALSGTAGHFSVVQMSPGRYDLGAERTGYVQTATQSVSLKPGQQLTDLKVKMARATMLVGRVVDRFGDPVASMNVRMIAIPPTKLSPSLTQGVPSQTDDRGEFHILTGPGRYYLEAEPQPMGKIGPPEMRTDGTAEIAYGPTYYPNSAVKERASVVEAIAGRDMEGLDIHLIAPASQRLLNVSGIVRGTPAEDGGFIVGYLAGGEGMGGQVFVVRDGRFTVSGLLPGDYIAAAKSDGTARLVAARTKFTLEANDVRAVELVLREPGELVGTLEMSGSAEKPKVRLDSMGGSPIFGGDNVSGEVGADGSFHFANVWPDRFLVVVDPLPETGYVKSMELDGDAVTDNTIEVWGGHVPRLKITVGLDGGAISGKVLDKDGEPLQEVRVLLADPKGVKQRAYAGDGKYNLKGIRPGKYRLIAFPVSEAVDTDKLFAAAEDIELRPGERIVKDLTYATEQ